MSYEEIYIKKGKCNVLPWVSHEWRVGVKEFQSEEDMEGKGVEDSGGPIADNHIDDLE